MKHLKKKETSPLVELYFQEIKNNSFLPPSKEPQYLIVEEFLKRKDTTDRALLVATNKLRRALMDLEKDIQMPDDDIAHDPKEIIDGSYDLSDSEIEYVPKIISMSEKVQKLSFGPDETRSIEEVCSNLYEDTNLGFYDFLFLEFRELLDCICTHAGGRVERNMMYSWFGIYHEDIPITFGDIKPHERRQKIANHYSMTDSLARTKIQKLHLLSHQNTTLKYIRQNLKKVLL